MSHFNSNEWKGEWEDRLKDNDPRSGLPVNDEYDPKKATQYIVTILLLALLLPPYIWLARTLWEWALG